MLRPYGKSRHISPVCPESLLTRSIQTTSGCRRPESGTLTHLYYSSFANTVGCSEHISIRSLSLVMIPPIRQPLSGQSLDHKQYSESASSRPRRIVWIVRVCVCLRRSRADGSGPGDGCRTTKIILPPAAWAEASRVRCSSTAGNQLAISAEEGSGTDG